MVANKLARVLVVPSAQHQACVLWNLKSLSPAIPLRLFESSAPDYLHSLTRLLGGEAVALSAPLSPSSWRHHPTGQCKGESANGLPWEKLGLEGVEFSTIWLWSRCWYFDNISLGFCMLSSGAESQAFVWEDAIRPAGPRRCTWYPLWNVYIISANSPLPSRRVQPGEEKEGGGGEASLQPGPSAINMFAPLVPVFMIMSLPFSFQFCFEEPSRAAHLFFLKDTLPAFTFCWEHVFGWASILR